STDGSVYALAVGGGVVYAGGVFTKAGGVAHAGLAAFDAPTGAVRSFAAGVAGPGPLVAALELSGSTLYVGGAFTTLGSSPRTNLGSIDLTSGQATPWNPAPNDLVNAIAAGAGGKVFVGGFFTKVNNTTVTRNYAAA